MRFIWKTVHYPGEPIADLCVRESRGFENKVETKYLPLTSSGNK